MNEYRSGVLSYNSSELIKKALDKGGLMDHWFGVNVEASAAADETMLGLGELRDLCLYPVLHAASIDGE